MSAKETKAHGTPRLLHAGATPAHRVAPVPFPVFHDDSDSDKEGSDDGKHHHQHQQQRQQGAARAAATAPAGRAAALSKRHPDDDHNVPAAQSGGRKQAIVVGVDGGGVAGAAGTAASVGDALLRDTAVPSGAGNGDQVSLLRQLRHENAHLRAERAKDVRHIEEVRVRWQLVLFDG